jgi:transcriptional regulator with XRE-family HTH domain
MKERFMRHEKLGMRVKKYREMKNVSFDELVERTGLAPEFLRSVEEEDLYPSLGPLIKISRALGVRLGTFLDDHVSEDPLILRLGEREEEFNIHAGKESPVAMTYFSLGKGKSDRHMEPFFIELLPASEEDKKLSSHEGEEFIIVHSGEVEVLYGKTRHVLKAGDSVYYNSVVPHHVGTAGGGKAEIYAVLYLPQ